MTKLRIIGQDTEFIDNWNINSTDIGGARIKGNCVQRLSKDGKWYDTYNAGKPIEKLLWCENGSIMAVTQDGQVKHAMDLACNPKNKPKVSDYVIDDGSKANAAKEEKASKKNKSEEKSGKKFFPAGWWYKWPAKGLWKATKFIFWGLLFGAMSKSGNDK